MKYQKIGNIAVEADLATELAKYKKSADFSVAAATLAAVRDFPERNINRLICFYRRRKSNTIPLKY